MLWMMSLSGVRPRDPSWERFLPMVLPASSSQSQLGGSENSPSSGRFRAKLQLFLGPSSATTFPEKFEALSDVELLLGFSSPGLCGGLGGARRGLRGRGGCHALPAVLWGRFNSFQIRRVHVSA